MSNKEIMWPDEKPEFRKLIAAAENAFPKNELKQLDYVKQHGDTLSYLLLLLRLAQHKMSREGFSTEIKFGAPELDLLFRGMLAMMRHLQDNLPEHMYKFIKSNIEFFVRKTLQSPDSIDR